MRLMTLLCVLPSPKIEIRTPELVVRFLSPRLRLLSAIMAPVWSRLSKGHATAIVSKASVCLWVYLTYRWLPRIRY
jgi:hypothetical protein